MRKSNLKSSLINSWLTEMLPPVDRIQREKTEKERAALFVALLKADF
jgi:hypothetical protein